MGLNSQIRNPKLCVNLFPSLLLLVWVRVLGIVWIDITVSQSPPPFLRPSRRLRIPLAKHPSPQSRHRSQHPNHQPSNDFHSCFLVYRLRPRHRLVPCVEFRSLYLDNKAVHPVAFLPNLTLRHSTVCLPPSPSPFPFFLRVAGELCFVFIYSFLGWQARRLNPLVVHLSPSLVQANVPCKNTQRGQELGHPISRQRDRRWCATMDISLLCKGGAPSTLRLRRDTCHLGMVQPLHGFDA